MDVKAMCDSIEEEELFGADSTTEEEEDPDESSSEDEWPEDKWPAWQPDGDDLAEWPGTSILVHPSGWTCRDHQEDASCGLRCPCCRARINEEGNYFGVCSICRPRTARAGRYQSDPWQCATVLGLHTPEGREGLHYITLSYVLMVRATEWSLFQHANRLVPPDESAPTLSLAALARWYDSLERKELLEWAAVAAARITAVPEERVRLRQMLEAQEKMEELVDWRLIRALNRLAPLEVRMSPTALACWYEGLGQEERAQWTMQAFEVATTIRENDYLDEHKAAAAFIEPAARLSEARHGESKAPGEETTQSVEGGPEPGPEGQSTAPARDQNEVTTRYLNVLLAWQK